ncbi:hypothetical protein BDZ89DRAFT_982679 [Hymenopellis radicata]|nr:hypothetical protein BDZ89DRAFT_982679 [Hymenopellis radicata]
MHPTLAVLKKAVFVPELKAGVASQPFKRAQEGLFQGRSKQYGNNVPFSKHKTRRSWLPNVQNKRLFSEALNETIKLKVTARAVKTISKHGGLDNYLLKGSEPKDLSDEGMRLRVRILEAMRNAKKHYIPPIESPLERSRVLASRATKRIRRMGMPTLQDAAKVRVSVMGKLGLATPDKDPCVVHRQSFRCLTDVL